MPDRLLVVVRAASVDAANRAAAVVNPPGAEDTFDQPLKLAGDATNTIVAYWCSWQLTAGTKAALLDAFHDEGFTTAELQPIPPEDNPTPAHNIFVFDADEWTSNQVGLALNVRRIPVDYP